jgi:hypothetical protein
VQQQSRTNNTIEALRDPTHPDDPKISGGLPFDGLEHLAQRVLDKRIDAASLRLPCLCASDGRHGCWMKWAGSFETGLDSETKDWMYAHQRLLNAKQALVHGARPAQHRLTTAP